MDCQWQEFINLLPVWLKEPVDRLGRESLQELRLLVGQAPQLILCGEVRELNRNVRDEDIRHVINIASQYSPWTSETVRYGYIATKGGHRVGICGNAVYHNGNLTGIRTPSSLCLRVARDFPGIGAKARSLNGSILIIGPPGSGKTTLLRDVIRQKSDNCGARISVVDEKGELFPFVCGGAGFSTGRNTDVLSGFRKREGIEIALRNMGPSWIAVDEITAQEDCDALLHAGWCGVHILATAHAASREDLLRRPIYRPIVKCGLFDNLITLQRDKTWSVERMNI